MVLLSVLRTKRKGRSAELLARVRRPATTS
jgi:hypothetical protein